MNFWDVNMWIDTGIDKLFMRTDKKTHSYDGKFIDIGGALFFGANHGFLQQGASSFSFTISDSYGLYAGGDFYFML